MACLDATFTLTPRTPLYWKSATNNAALFCYGADFAYIAPTDLPSLNTTNRFFFDAAFASDPALDYTLWPNRQKARFLDVSLGLQDFGTNKQLALVFAFDVLYSSVNGRVQVYSDAGLLHDQPLVYGDNQFLIELESLDQYLSLYFVHAGGYWFFKGLSGYVV
jgi:hypothetical protein